MIPALLDPLRPLAAGLGLLLPLAAAAQSLVPAGSINGAIARKPAVVLTHDDPALLRFVTAIRDRFFAGAEILTGERAATADLHGKAASSTRPPRTHGSPRTQPRCRSRSTRAPCGSMASGSPASGCA